MFIFDLKSILLPQPSITLTAGCGKEAEPGNISLAKIVYQAHILNLLNTATDKTVEA